jgi:hypothetical protein
MKNLIHPLKMRRNLVNVQKLNGTHLELGIVFMLNTMFAPARREIVQDSDSLRCSIQQQRINQVGANKARLPRLPSMSTTCFLSQIEG